MSSAHTLRLPYDTIHFVGRNFVHSCHAEDCSDVEQVRAILRDGSTNTFKMGRVWYVFLDIAN